MAASIKTFMAALFNFTMIIFAFVLFLSSCFVSYAAKLSDPKVLLPYQSSVVINFTLKINLTKEESRNPTCFVWRSSRLDVATVQLINSTDNGCALSAEISAVSKTSHHKTSIIMVENMVTGEMLKCIVIVDSIHHIEIETTTRLLYLEDSPEEMVVRGYDIEGNVFSSLQGLEFKWSLHSDTLGENEDIIDANSMLRILKFSDSHYMIPPHIVALEEKGRQGDIILVEGVRTGRAVVSTELRDPAYQAVTQSSVRLMVIANLMVSPPEAYVLKFASVKYKVEQIRQSSVIEISMPSSQFYLNVVNKAVCVLDAATSVATAQDIGETEIKLIDKNIKSTDVLGQPTAVLHVVNPSYLAFVVLPDRRWVLETGHVYTVLIEVYDKHSHKLYPSDNVIINTVFDDQYFSVQYSTTNGTYHIVKALSKGETNIKGVLSTVITQDGTEHSVAPLLNQTQFVEIFDPIVVQPNLIFFPWDSVLQTSHRYTLKATGGSGDYVWSSLNTDIVMVNKYGEISTLAQGAAEVVAADTRNQLHKGSAMVHIVPPTAIEFRPYRVEIEVGNVLDLPLDVITFFEGKKYSYRDCRNMPLNVSFSDPTIVECEEGYSFLAEGSCRTIKVKAIQQGHTQVKAKYSHGGIKLECSVTISTYEKLVLFDPETEAVVALGSLKELVFLGGPQPWVLDSSKYFQILSSGESKNLLIQQVRTIGAQKKQHVFFVTCKNIGEQKITLMVGNEKTARNQHPVVEEASISFVCAEPVEIHLHPEIEYNADLPPCPVSREPNELVPVHCERELYLEVSITDKNGRKFDNISSLEFVWSLSDSSLAKIGDDLETRTSIAPSGRNVVKNYILVQPQGKAGSVVVSVSIANYKTVYLQLVKSSLSEVISPKISKSIDLRLVEEAVVSPEVISLFNHPSNYVNVAVSKGSGFFHVVKSKDGIVEIKYADKEKNIHVTPVADGQMTVTVHDMCIVSSQPAKVVLSVSGVSTIQLYIMDKVEVGKHVTASVQVLDLSGDKLFASFFHLMGLTVESASDIITVKKDTVAALDDYTATYNVHGAILGHTFLKAVAYLPDRRTVSSTAKPIEVFPPLQLIPRNITLIVGALFQVLSKGGPTPQCTVLFSIKNDKISKVSSSGLLEGKSLGSTRVIGQAIGQHPETSETVIYSQDEVTVNVVKLAGIRIHSPLTQIPTGTTMPVYAVGLTEHETPFTFGSAVPALSFKWSVNKKDVVLLQSVFHKSAILPQSDGDFATRLVALETGHVSIHLEVTHPGVVNGVVLTDELQIQVFEELAILSPRVPNGELLMTQNTEATLKTNRDGGATVTYTVLDHGKDIISVVDGILRSGSNFGQAALQVVAVEESGVTQTLVILVKVKSVSYMMINSDTVLRTSGSRLSTVPRGTTLHLTVTYHDDMGKKFYATNIDMRYRCSRYDLVQISNGLENNTLVVKTAPVGNTILKVWDRTKFWLVDYISIPVGHAIKPAQTTVQLGDIVCFEAPLTTDDGKSGWWFGNAAIDVDNRLGIGYAMATGTGIVSYMVSDSIMTETEVYVQPISVIALEMGLEFITSVSSSTSTKVYNIFLAMGKEVAVQGNDCSALVADEKYQPVKLPISCEISFDTANQNAGINDIFMVKAVFIAKSGRYACQITPVLQADEQELRTADVNIVVMATVQPIKGQPEIRSAPVSIPFLPPFYVHNTEIHISTLSPLSTIRISAGKKQTAQMQVVVSDSTILEALAPEEDSKSNIIIYPIRLLNTVALWEREQLDVWVDLIGVKTGQKVKVPVFIRLIGQKSELIGLRYGSIGWAALLSNIFSNYQYWFILLVIIIVTVLTLLFGYHAIFGSRYKVAANTSGMSGMMGSTPGTPVGPVYQPVAGSPQAYLSYSPQIPRSPMSFLSGYTPLDGSSATRRRSPLQRISSS